MLYLEQGADKGLLLWTSSRKVQEWAPPSLSSLFDFHGPGLIFFITNTG